MTQKLSENQLAEALHLSARHVHRLLRAGMPRSSVQAAKAWRARNIVGSLDASDVVALRAEVLRLRADLLKLEISERERLLIPTAEAQRLLTGAGVSCRARLGTVDRQLMAEHPHVGQEVIATLKRLIAQALEAISIDIAKGEGEPA